MLHVLIVLAAVQSPPMIDVNADAAPPPPCPVVESGAPSDAAAACGARGPRIAVIEGAPPARRAQRDPAPAAAPPPRIRLETQASYDGDRYVILSMDSTPDSATEDMRRLTAAAGRVSAYVPAWKTEGY